MTTYNGTENSCNKICYLKGHSVMIRVAAIKFGGLAAGGSEKWLQTIVCNLPKDRFVIDYFYCDSAPYIGSSWVHPDTDPSRKSYMEKNEISLKKFRVAAKNITIPTHDWVDTDFWSIFDEDNYDIILSARAGHLEYPFYRMKTPEVSLITLAGMAERNENTKKYIHISEFQKKKWIDAGGDPSKAEVVWLFTEHKATKGDNLKETLGLEGKTVIGLHQRAENTIFSPIPLLAYSRVRRNDTVFLLKGGGDLYKKQANDLGLNDVVFLPHSADENELNLFLRTLDVYAHGRADGETYGQCIAEAMSYGVPVVSHTAASNGHIETVGDGGIVVNSIDEYIEVLKNFLENPSMRKTIGSKAKLRFDNHLSIDNNMKRIRTIIEEVYKKESSK